MAFSIRVLTGVEKTLHKVAACAKRLPAIFHGTCCHGQSGHHYMIPVIPVADLVDRSTCWYKQPCLSFTLVVCMWLCSRMGPFVYRCNATCLSPNLQNDEPSTKSWPNVFIELNSTSCELKLIVCLLILLCLFFNDPQLKRRLSKGLEPGVTSRKHSQLPSFMSLRTLPQLPQRLGYFERDN